VADKKKSDPKSTGPVRVHGETVITERMRSKNGKVLPRHTTHHAVTAGTQSNVPEEGGQSVRYRQETGAGRRGKQSSDVFMVEDAPGGEGGFVGVSTLGGKMKYKPAGTSPTGEVTTGFRNPSRAKRAKQAIEDTPSYKKDVSELMREKVVALQEGGSPAPVKKKPSSKSR